LKYIEGFFFATPTVDRPLTIPQTAVLSRKAQIMKTYGLIRYYDSTGTVTHSIHPSLWQFYYDKLTNSFITDHVLIIDELFYNTLPFDGPHIMFKGIILVTKNPDFVPKVGTIIVVDSLLKALMYPLIPEQEKKRFIADTPMLSSLMRKLRRHYQPDEIVTMQVDNNFEYISAGPICRQKAEKKCQSFLFTEGDKRFVLTRQIRNYELA